MKALPEPLPLIDDELALLAELVPLHRQDIIELGCGNAALARALLLAHPGSRVAALEVDERQHAKNLAAPQPGLQFVAAGAQAVPFADARFDLALMLKSLHHVPLPLLAKALGEAARVLRPGAHLYVSEPVFAGAFNEVVRLFNDEETVRIAAQGALDDALLTGAWEAAAERWFETRVRFADYSDFEQRLMRATYADHRIDDALRRAVQKALAPHTAAGGIGFTRPVHVRLLRRTGVPTWPPARPPAPRAGHGVAPASAPAGW